MVTKLKTIGRAIRIMRQRPRFDAYWDLSSPATEKRIRRLSSSSQRKHERMFSCVNFPTKKAKNLITVLVGPERQAFAIEPQILDHGVVQCLVQKTRSAAGQESDAIIYKNYDWGMLKTGRSGASRATARIFLDCDAILFDHILWLLNNDDPSLRHLNLDELMEFYSQ
ncbi:hypothetical protein O6H91_09G049800 [Diphasiastrum complanatum]|nr:hypothetical protein O6H91_09G049800 [Diphasiastrum complanatum]